MLVAVPCSDDDCLVLLDGETGVEQGRVAVGAHPVHLATIDDRVFVATMGERAVSVIVNGDVRRVETGVLGPSHFAATDDGDVLVPCTGGDALAIVDVERLELSARVGVGGEPHDVAVRDGRAFVGSRADGTVTVVDPASATVEATHDLGSEAVGSGSDAIGTDANRSDARVQGVEAAAEGIYAVDQRNARLVRLTGDGVEGSVPVGADPYDAVVAETRVLVAGRDDGTVTAVPRDGELGEGAADGPDRRVYDVGGRPSDVVLADGGAWVLDRERPRLRPLGAEPTSGDAIPESETASPAEPAAATREIDLPFPTFAGSVSPANDALAFVTHYDDAAVSAVDLDVGRVVWTTETPAHPFEPAVI